MHYSASFQMSFWKTICSKQMEPGDKPLTAAYSRSSCAHLGIWQDGYTCRLPGRLWGMWHPALPVWDCTFEFAPLKKWIPVTFQTLEASQFLCNSMYEAQKNIQRTAANQEVSFKVLICSLQRFVWNSESEGDFPASRLWSQCSIAYFSKSEVSMVPVFQTI